VRCIPEALGRGPYRSLLPTPCGSRDSDRRNSRRDGGVGERGKVKYLACRKRPPATIRRRTSTSDYRAQTEYSLWNAMWRRNSPDGARTGIGFVRIAQNRCTCARVEWSLATLPTGQYFTLPAFTNSPSRRLFLRSESRDPHGVGSRDRYGPRPSASGMHRTPLAHTPACAHQPNTLDRPSCEYSRISLPGYFIAPAANRLANHSRYRQSIRVRRVQKVDTRPAPAYRRGRLLSFRSP